MSKKLSFRGRLDDGVQEQIRLDTKKGQVGYRITKFQIIQTQPGAAGADVELVAKIYSKDQSGLIAEGIDFTESDLMGVSLYNANSAAFNYPTTTIVIFDNAITNQDIFIYAYDKVGTAQINYYIELETIALTSTQATQLTLKSLREIASR